MRTIKYIAIHCTATQPNAKIESILKYWRNVKKWKSPGYHYIIEANGHITQLLPDSEISNGVAGFNSVTVNVSYIGGIDQNGKPKDTRTPEQIITLEQTLRSLKKRYPLAKIQGHKDFPNVKKACPSFDVKNWLTTLNIS